MKNTFQKIPFLRPSIWLVVGILIGSYFNISILGLTALAVLQVIGLVFIHKKYNFRLKNWFGIILQLFFLTTGVLVFEIHNTKPVFYKDGIFIATIIEKPQEKKNSFKSVLEVTLTVNHKTKYPTQERMLVYFQKDEHVKYVNTGDRIAFNAAPQFIKNYGNPFEFDYKKYLNGKRIYRQIYLSSEKWKKIDTQSGHSLLIYAEKIREQLLSIYNNKGIGEIELKILSALTLGYKRELDPETTRVFSSAGAMHVLAVSGLHVGIIYWLISIFFGFLQKRRWSKPVFIILTISSLWAYALITGLSPSVTRASTMFTIFIIGDNLNRKANTYNSLAASALILLLFNPNSLFEIGFQLSYTAVFGIVYLQPKLHKTLYIKNKILNFFWSLFTVSIAAQIATFPLTAYYFNQFPTYFWITNIFIIPAVMILIPLGMFLLIFSQISLISTILSSLLNSIIKWSYAFLSKIEHLPYSTIDVSLVNAELLFLLALLISVFLLMENFNAIHLKIVFFFVLALLTTSLFFHYTRFSRRELIVYNSNSNQIVQLINGRTSFVISKNPVQKESNDEQLIKRTCTRLKLNSPTYLSTKDSLVNTLIYLKHGMVLFNGKTILFAKDYNSAIKAISPDFIIDMKRMEIKDSSHLKSTTLITNNKFIKDLKPDFMHIHQLAEKGAFRENW